MKKSLSRYFIVQFFFSLIIFIFVYLFSLHTFTIKSEAIVSNLRNDLLIGDYKNVQLNIQNSELLGYENIIIKNPNDEIIIKSNSKNITIDNIAINNYVKSSESSNLINFRLIFYFSFLQVIKTSLILSIFFAMITIPYIFYENKRLLRLHEELKTNEKNNELRNSALQLSHDIRSPLATLNTISENLTSKNKEDLKLLKLSINRINQISNSLLAQGKESNSKINLNETILNLVELKKVECPSANIKFNFNENCVYNTIGNKTEFERMLSNLINNSVEASSEPQIELELKPIENIVALSIKDNGGGIPSKVLNELGKKNISTKENGNGLGLSHALKTVESLKAELKVDSSTSGTKLEILFENVERSESTPSLSILIDDDELTRMNWEYKAKKANKELRIFKNKEDLYSQLENIDKNATFYIDSELGKSKGEEIAIDLNQKGFTTIFMASGHGSEHFQELTFLKGVIDKTPPF